MDSKYFTSPTENRDGEGKPRRFSRLRRLSSTTRLLPKIFSSVRTKNKLPELPSSLEVKEIDRPRAGAGKGVEPVASPGDFAPETDANEIFPIDRPLDFQVHAGPSTLAAWDRCQIERQRVAREAQEEEGLMQEIQEEISRMQASDRKETTEASKTQQKRPAQTQLETRKTDLSTCKVPFSTAELDPETVRRRAASYADRITVDAWLLGRHAFPALSTARTMQDRLQRDEATACGLIRVAVNCDEEGGVTHRENISIRSSACTSESSRTGIISGQTPRRTSSMQWLRQGWFPSRSML